MIENRLAYRELSYGKVELKDTYCQNAYAKEKKYLKQLSADRLLAGFRATAGLKEKAKRYPGWEVTEIQGHTLGHYLSAIAQGYAYDGDEEFKNRVTYICQELADCQREDGYLFAWAEEIFDRVENRKPAWVPWYTMHKIFEGLLLAYELAGDETGLDVAKKLGIWVHDRVIQWSPEMKTQVLSVEYGGMNDVLYELYRITEDDRYRAAAEQFDEFPLFTAMQERRDVLNGLHANTTIPKILGAFNGYLATGNASYLDTAEKFFTMVEEHHTYITGGNSEWEHFGEPDILDAERTACNCETCNTYNMLKLSKGLFQVTGKKKYADFYERTWTNAILSSQNPDTGMTMYFQPMATGFFKVYSTPFDKFWCCTGTGMENFSKLHESIYFERNRNIYVNRYVSSLVHDDKIGIAFAVEADLPKKDVVSIAVHNSSAEPLTFHLRIPDWNAGQIGIAVNGKQAAYGVKDGYALVMIPAGDTRVQMKFQMEVQYQTLPDNKNAVAFSYGPVVLSAKLGTQMMDTSVTGVDVTVPKKDFYVKDYLILQNTTAKEWREHLREHLVREGEELVFALKGTDQDLKFVPHYGQHKERYGIYWVLFEKDSPQLEMKITRDQQKEKLQRECVDLIPVGNDQYELAHHVQGFKTDIVRKDGFVCRFITEDGWLKYDMKVSKDPQKLCMKYCVDDAGSKFEILIDGELLVAEALQKTALEVDEKGFYKKYYEIPESFTTGKDMVEVRIQNKEVQQQCRIYDEMYIQEQGE